MSRETKHAHTRLTRQSVDQKLPATARGSPSLSPSFPLPFPCCCLRDCRLRCVSPHTLTRSLFDHFHCFLFSSPPHPLSLETQALSHSPLACSRCRSIRPFLPFLSQAQICRDPLLLPCADEFSLPSRLAVFVCVARESERPFRTRNGRMREGERECSRRCHVPASRRQRKERERVREGSLHYPRSFACGSADDSTRQPRRRQLQSSSCILFESLSMQAAPLPSPFASLTS